MRRSVAVLAAIVLAGPLWAQSPVPRPIETVVEDPIALDLSGRPASRRNDVPRARWEHRQNGDLWTRVAMAAVQTHGAPLLNTVPSDIAQWCPAYPSNDEEGRAAFWTALLSTLSRYESTWDPNAVGGGGFGSGFCRYIRKRLNFETVGFKRGKG